jgi:[acyl-carrier-protein] S-malonyltransferase
MGRELVESSPAARALFERADPSGALRRIIFEGPEAELTRTTHAQPAIVTVSCAALEALRERYPAMPSPACAAGHSLGEYSAYVAAGALPIEAAVSLVRLRGQAMQEAVPEGVGAMAAIMGLAPDVVESVCAAVSSEGSAVSCANFNAPGQVVVAGHAAAVERAVADAQSRGGKAIPLKVSAPFHCPLMAPAAARVEDALRDVAMTDPRFPIFANFTASPVTTAAEAKRLLVAQVDGTVRWEATVRSMVEAGVTHALEIGPGKVLAGLAKRISKELRVLSVGDAKSLDEAGAFFDSIQA